VFYSFGRRLFYCHFLKKVLIQSGKTVFYDCFDALQLQHATASLALFTLLSVRLSVRNRCIVANC